MSNERLSQTCADEGAKIIGFDVQRSRSPSIDEVWPAHLTNDDDIRRSKAACELGRENASEMEADRIKKAANNLNYVIDEASQIVRPSTLHDDSKLTLADKDPPLGVRERHGDGFVVPPTQTLWVYSAPEFCYPFGGQIGGHDLSLVDFGRRSRTPRSLHVCRIVPTRQISQSFRAPQPADAPRAEPHAALGSVDLQPACERSHRTGLGRLKPLPEDLV